METVSAHRTGPRLLITDHHAIFAEDQKNECHRLRRERENKHEKGNLGVPDDGAWIRGVFQSALFSG